MKTTQLGLDDQVIKPRVGSSRGGKPGSRLGDLVRREEQTRAWFRASGITVADWARERGFSVELTRMVLAGKRKCLRGQSYEIAAALQIVGRAPREHG